MNVLIALSQPEVHMFFNILTCHLSIFFCELSEHVSDDLTLKP